MRRRHIRPVVRLGGRHADVRPELRRTGHLEKRVKIAIEYVLPRESWSRQRSGEFEFIGSGGSNNFAEFIILMAAELLEQLRFGALAQLRLALERRRRRSRRALLGLRGRRFEEGGVAGGGVALGGREACAGRHGRQRVDEVIESGPLPWPGQRFLPVCQGNYFIRRIYYVHPW